MLLGAGICNRKEADTKQSAWSYYDLKERNDSDPDVFE